MMTARYRTYICQTFCKTKAAFCNEGKKIFHSGAVGFWRYIYTYRIGWFHNFRIHPWGFDTCKCSLGRHSYTFLKTNLRFLHRFAIMAMYGYEFMNLCFWPRKISRLSRWCVADLWTKRTCNEGCAGNIRFCLKFQGPNMSQQVAHVAYTAEGVAAIVQQHVTLAMEHLFPPLPENDATVFQSHGAVETQWCLQFCLVSACAFVCEISRRINPSFLPNWNSVGLKQCQTTCNFWRATRVSSVFTYQKVSDSSNSGSFHQHLPYHVGLDVST